MTKLSDALRGAADRAPVDGATVSSSIAASRVARQRGLRGAANGLVGVGAVSLLAFGFIASGLGSMGDPSKGGPGAKGGDGNFRAEGAEDMAMNMGMCGGYPADWDASGEGPVALSAGIDGDSTALTGGDAVDVTVTTTAVEDVDALASAPVVQVLWNGMVVAHIEQQTMEMRDVELAAGEVSTLDTSVVLGNCWDGEPLPGGKYELLVSQSFFANDSAAPTQNPDTPVTDAEAPDMDLDRELAEARPAIEPDRISADTYWAVAEPVAFVVEGDVPEDPFGQYLYPTPIEVDLPDNYLTPEIARQLYAAGATSSGWNMAEGSQRWVLRDGTDMGNPSYNWEANYFGCSYDGVAGSRFPSQSAELDLINYQVNFPRSINLSYGWVVDDNPVMSVTARNISDYAIPGFHGTPSPELFLVRDGRVVAEGWPQVANRTAHDAGLMYEEGAPEGMTSERYIMDLGLLQPGDSVTDQFLWREVNGCWNDATGQAVVGPGTYTLLTTQSFYLQSGSDYYGGGDIAYYDEGVDSSARDLPSPEMIDPSYGSYDYVDLQVWTSLGTVTITN